MKEKKGIITIEIRGIGGLARLVDVANYMVKLLNSLLPGYRVTMDCHMEKA